MTTVQPVGQFEVPRVIVLLSPRAAGQRKVPVEDTPESQLFVSPLLHEVNATWTKSGLTGRIPAWSVSIANANSTYQNCSGLNGTIPEWTNTVWTNVVTSVGACYSGCTGLTGNVPAWGGAIATANNAYYGCCG